MKNFSCKITVVCSHFGLDTGARSFPYIALWSRDKHVLKNVLSTVQRISAGIIDGVEEGRNLPEDESLRRETAET